jgi:hypothetical protein
MKTKRTYKAGRPITGWTYGKRVTSVGQLKVGDYLIGDSHQFHATNLYRVTKIIPDKSRFCVIYVRPNRRTTKEREMCVWNYELKPERHPYYFAHRRDQE